MEDDAVIAVGRSTGLLRAALLWLVIALVGAITILPFLWMISTSLKEPSEALVPPDSLAAWIPHPVVLDNYTTLFTSDLLPFAAFFLNSFKITLIVVVGRLLLSALAGYAFATMEFVGRDQAFALLMASLMVPAIVTIFPIYVAYAQIGWLDTHWPLIVPPMLASAFGTFLLRQYFMTVPRELGEAAVMDGAGQLTIFARIYLPLAGPVMATLAIFTFQATWNDFFDALIFLNKTPNFTVPMGLAFFNSSYGREYTRLMAGSCLSMIPILVVYAFAQKYFTRGISLTGLKG
jgi:multiple sugar transport system permease protein